MNDRKKFLDQFKRIRPKEIQLEDNGLENSNSNIININDDKKIVISSKQQENSQLMQILKAQRDDFQTKIMILERQVEMKKERNEKEKMKYNKQIENLKDKIQQQEEEIRKLTEDPVPSPDFNYEKKKTEMEELRDELLKKKDEADLNVQQLGRNLLEAKQKLKDTKETVKSLPQAESIESVLKAKRQMEIERDSKISFFKRQISQIESDCKELNQILDETVQKGTELQQENEKLNAAHSKLENAIRVASKNYSKLKQQCEENGIMLTPEEVHARLKETEDLKNEEIKKKTAEMEEKYQQALRDQEIMNQDLNERIATVEQLNRKIESLTHNLQTCDKEAKTEIRNLKAEHQRKITQLKEQLRIDLANALKQQRERMINAAKMNQMNDE